MTFHNPDNLRPEQVDPDNEGWRLLTVEELDNPPEDTEYWAGAQTAPQWSPNQERAKIKSRAITYRTKALFPRKSQSEIREDGKNVVEHLKVALTKDCPPSTPVSADDGPGEEDGPWAEGWNERAAKSPDIQITPPLNDGGPAFPQPDTYPPNDQVQHGSPGMSLRDYFAGQALIRLISSATDASAVATHAYAIADAMLEARKGGAK
jgi:hypothetical protein